MIVVTLVIKMWLIRNTLTVKTFTLSVSKGLDMKGNKVIKQTQHVPQLEAMKGMLIQKRAII